MLLRDLARPAAMELVLGRDALDAFEDAFGVLEREQAFAYR